VAAHVRTTLVNRGVCLEVVKQLLDHASLEMASHYARLLDTTIRAEWDAARDNDDNLRHLLPADVEWANRSRTALPNGRSTRVANGRALSRSAAGRRPHGQLRDARRG
jgi:hypothetical protein